MKIQRQKIFILALICLVILTFNNCINEQKKPVDIRGAAYAGSTQCINCHKEIYDSYIKTAHNLTSSAASANTIKGSFAKDANTFYYRPDLKVVMELRDSGFYQVAYQDDKLKKAVRFDIVTGSGTKGQTYLYWHRDNIYQLPISYNVPGKTWANSPNFPPHNVQFTRNIPVGCFECHSSYIRKTASTPSGGYLVDHFETGSIIYGIDCERCHGAAAEHVVFHQNNPQEKKAKFIAVIAGLPRQEKLDMCAMCHSGARQTIASPFDFKPGSTLAAYLYPDTSSLDTKQIDVHGKQYQLLSASKCFLNSNNLSCATCHDAHTNERGNLTTFSARCMSCHPSVDHSAMKLSDSARAGFVNNCIDCHMPARPSSVITMQEQDQSKPVPALVRTHFYSCLSIPRKEKFNQKSVARNL